MPRCFLLFVILFAACSKAPPPTKPLSPDDSARLSHRETAERIVVGSVALPAFVDGDRVVSRYADGRIEHEGDGLIWLGVTLAGLPCDMGLDLEARAAAGIVADNGSLSRHPSRPDDASLDGALGLYRGVIERSVRCGRGDVWREAMQKHVDLLDRTGGRLNERGSAIIALDFIAVARLAAIAAGANVRRPTDAELGRLEAEAVGFAKVVAGGYRLWKAGLVDKAPACFRLHLSYLTLRSMERSGVGVSGGGRASFCDTVDFADLPLVEHWCGRGDLVGWIQSFQHDLFEFQHQRCTEYESPDGKPDLHTPGVDKLIAEREAYDNL